MTATHLGQILDDKRRRIERGEYRTAGGSRLATTHESPPSSAGDVSAGGPGAAYGRGSPFGGRLAVPRTPWPRPGSGAARFLAALRAEGVRVIAEIKARSPSAGEILESPEGRLGPLARAYRDGGAAAISVVTEEDHFGGRPEWVSRVRELSGLPVLMKDFFLSEDQLDHALALGADAVLLIVGTMKDGDLLRLRRAARDRGLATIVEAHGEAEIRRAAALSPDVLGVNARDLRTFRVNGAALLELARIIPEGPLRLAESGIRTREEVAAMRSAGYDAFLVGEALLRAADPETALRRLCS